MSDKQDLEPLLNAQQSQLDLSLADGSGIENKALAILASNIAVLLFVAQAGFSFAPWWHAIVLVGPFVFSALLTILAFWPRQYDGPLVSLDKHPEYFEMGRDDLLIQLLADAQSAEQHNLAINDRRWAYCVAAIISAAVGVIVLFAIL